MVKITFRGDWIANVEASQLVPTDDHKGYIDSGLTHASAEIGSALKRPFNNDLLMRAPEFEEFGLVGLYESLTEEEWLKRARKELDGDRFEKINPPLIYDKIIKLPLENYLDLIPDKKIPDFRLIEDIKPKDPKGGPA